MAIKTYPLDHPHVIPIGTIFKFDGIEPELAAIRSPGCNHCYFDRGDSLKYHRCPHVPCGGDDAMIFVPVNEAAVLRLKGEL